MTRPKGNNPLSSFDPSLQNALRLGGIKRVEITFVNNRRLATNFMQRLNSLRLAMRNANHPDWEQLYRCGISRSRTDDTVVILAPRDSEFLPFLNIAGIGTIDPPLEVVKFTVDPGASSGPTADDFLKSLGDPDVPKKDPELENKS